MHTQRMSKNMASRLLFWPLFYLLLAVVSPLLRKGGAPRESESRTVFPLRPGMKIVSYLLLAMGIYLIAGAWQIFSGAGSWLGSGFGALVCLGGVYCLSTSYSADAEGIHFRRLGMTKTISWQALQHYERFSPSSMGSEQVLFRGTDGQSIGIDELGQDATAMLTLVLAKKHLHEKPYKRRHWWGG